MNLRETNTRLNEALTAQAVHIEDLAKELDHQLSGLRSLCGRVQEPMSGTGGTQRTRHRARIRDNELYYTVGPESASEGVPAIVAG